jgi:hypothetical protein
MVYILQSDKFYRAMTVVPSKPHIREQSKVPEKNKSIVNLGCSTFSLQASDQVEPFWIAIGRDAIWLTASGINTAMESQFYRETHDRQ